MTSSKSLKILLTSGPIAVGKSSVVNALLSRFDFKCISSGNYLKELAESKGMAPVRENLIKLGDGLDIKTDYSWVVNQVTYNILKLDNSHSKWVFDSVRKKKQILYFRKKYENCITHIHFTAPEEILKNRYLERIVKGSAKDVSTYELAINNPNENEARSLGDFADYQIDTSSSSAEYLAEKINRILRD